MKYVAFQAAKNTIETNGEIVRYYQFLLGNLKITGRWVAFAFFASAVLNPSKVLADWQLVASNTIAGAAVPTTDWVVTKIQSYRARVDMSTNLSFLSFEDKPEQIQLNHAAKTYSRIPIRNIPNPPALPSTPLPAGEKATFVSQPVDLFCWTNGVERGKTWVAPQSRFLKSSRSWPAHPVQSEPSLQTGVGSAFGSNSIVVATEHTTVIPVPLTAFNSTADSKAITNLTITFSSALLSLTETNFADTEFQIPAGYRDATGEPPPVFRSPTNSFADKMIGQRNLEGLRKEYEKGRPVLIAPNLSK